MQGTQRSTRRSPGLELGPERARDGRRRVSEARPVVLIEVPVAERPPILKAWCQIRRGPLPSAGTLRRARVSVRGDRSGLPCLWRVGSLACQSLERQENGQDADRCFSVCIILEF